MKKVKFIYFDIGYTLVNEEKVWEARCLEQSFTDEAKQLGLSAEDIFKEIINASKNYLPQYRTVTNKYKFKEVAPYRSELEILYPQVKTVLTYLASKYKLGIIANQADGLIERLNEFEIAKYFSVIISSWDYGVMKPDLELFRIGIEKAECKPQEIVMVGDRLDNDIFPAKALGMNTVWVKQGFGGMQIPKSQLYEPTKEIDSLDELINIL